MMRKGQATFLLVLLISVAVCCDSFVLGRKSTAAPTTRSSSTNGSRNNKATPTPEEGQEADNGDDDDTTKVQMKTYNPLRLLVLKAGFTEPMYSSPLNYEKREGTYNCAFCGSTLFDANSKYNSKSGWPSFWRSYDEGSIDYKREFDGRLECRCKKCKSHLGHVFPDGPTFDEMKNTSNEKETLVNTMPLSDPKAATRLPRFCVNGASLNFNAREE